MNLHPDYLLFGRLGLCLLHSVSAEVVAGLAIVFEDAQLPLLYYLSRGNRRRLFDPNQN